MSDSDPRIPLPLDESAGPALRMGDRARAAAVEDVLAASSLDLPLDDAPGPSAPLGAQDAEQMVARILARARPALQSTTTNRTAPTPLVMSREATAEEERPIARTQRARTRTWVWAAAAVALLGSGLVLRSVREHGAAVQPSEEASRAELLARAHALVEENRPREAHDLFARVATRWPGTDDGDRAALAMASLRLDRLHDAEGALAAFQALAMRGGPHETEAWLGVARSARTLKLREVEIGALRSIVRARGPEAALAEKRLEELGAK